MSLMTELAEMQEKAQKFDALKQRNDEYAAVISEAIQLLQRLQKNIAPYNYIAKTTGTKRKNDPEIKEQVETLYKLVIGGTQMTTDLAQKTFPEASFNRISVVMKKLAEIKGLDKRYEGRQLFIFSRK